MRNHLELDAVCFSYNRSGDVIHDMSWRVSDGDIVGVYGPNGSGKTTLLDLLCGTLTPKSGRVSLGDAGVRTRARSIARIDAEFDMFDYLSLEDNVRFFLRFYSRTFERPAAHRLFERYQIGSARTQLAAHASRGMRRKTQLVAAILQAPHMLVADEALDGLDEEAQEAWIEDIHRLARRGTIVIHTLHDLQRLRAHSDYLLALSGEGVSRPLVAGRSRADGLTPGHARSVTLEAV